MLCSWSSTSVASIPVYRPDLVVFQEDPADLPRGFQQSLKVDSDRAEKPQRMRLETPDR